MKQVSHTTFPLTLPLPGTTTDYQPTPGNTFYSIGLLPECEYDGGADVPEAWSPYDSDEHICFLIETGKVPGLRPEA